MPINSVHGIGISLSFVWQGACSWSHLFQQARFLIFSARLFQSAIVLGRKEALCNCVWHRGKVMSSTRLLASLFLSATEGTEYRPGLPGIFSSHVLPQLQQTGGISSGFKGVITSVFIEKSMWCANLGACDCSQGRSTLAHLMNAI